MQDAHRVTPTALDTNYRTNDEIAAWPRERFYPEGYEAVRPGRRLSLTLSEPRWPVPITRSCSSRTTAPRSTSASHWPSGTGDARFGCPAGYGATVDGIRSGMALPHPVQDIDGAAAHLPPAFLSERLDQV